VQAKAADLLLSPLDGLRRRVLVALARSGPTSGPSRSASRVGPPSISNAYDGYLRLAVFHGHLELAAIALIFCEGRAALAPRESR